MFTSNVWSGWKSVDPEFLKIIPLSYEAQAAHEKLLASVTTHVTRLNEALTDDTTPHTTDEFYKKLIYETMNWRDTMACFGTVGANLTQNFFFLMKVIGSYCKTNEECTLALDITACGIDFFASGTQNIYQRFWKSVMWAWISRLPRPTAYFIKALHEYIKTKQKTEKKSYPAPNINILIKSIYLDQFLKEDYKKDLTKLHENQPSQLFKWHATPTLEQALKLISIFYSVKIQLNIDTTQSADLEDPIKGTIWHFNYSPDYVTTPGDATFDEPSLNFSRYVYEKFFWPETNYAQYIYDKGFLLILAREKLHPLNLYCCIFLTLIPCLMMCFQTVSMLSGTVTEETLTLPLANLFCIFGILFGLSKWSVNNTLRWDMARENLYSMFTLKYWRDSAIFLGHDIVGEFFYSVVPFVQCLPWRSLSFFLPALMRLFGIFIGISITLFYLDVGLYTKHGIQFTLSTFISDFGGNSEPAVAYYEKFHTEVDICCAIASLSFNGMLTQMPESIKKCDRLAKQVKNYFDPPVAIVEAQTRSNSPLLQKESQLKTPFWIHTANIIDIAVFTISALTAIQDLLDLAAGAKHGYSNLKIMALFLSQIDYAIVAGVGAGLSNLIFTYAAAADNQMHAWSYLGQKMGFFTSSPSMGNNSTSDLTATTNTDAPNSPARVAGESERVSPSSSPDSTAEEQKTDLNTPLLG